MRHEFEAVSLLLVIAVDSSPRRRLLLGLWQSRSRIRDPIVCSRSRRGTSARRRKGGRFSERGDCRGLANVDDRSVWADHTLRR